MARTTVYLINPFLSGDVTISRIGRCVTRAKAEYLYPPTELLYVAAYLRGRGIKVDVIDGALCDDLNALKSLIRVPDFFVSMVGIFSFDQDARFLNWLGENFPHVPKIVFGQGASCITEDYLKVADYVVCGEPEKPVLDIVNGTSEAAAVSYMRKGRKHISKVPNLIEDLNELPYPARDLLDNKTYRHAFLRPFALVYSSRGCPFNCTFCTSHSYSPIYRIRSVENVVGELVEIREEYGIRNFGFMDETFVIDKKRVIAICGRMIERSLNMDWIALGRVDTVDEKVLRHMKQAGCRVMLYGIESFDQEVIDSLNKKIKIQQIYDAIKLTKDAGIETHGFFVFGSPMDSEDKIVKTINEAKRIGLDYASFNTFVPYPGTEDFRRLEEKGRIKTKQWSDYDQALNKLVFRHERLSDDKIRKLVSSAYSEFYFNSAYIFKRLIKGALHPDLFMRNLSNLRKIKEIYGKTC